MASKSATLLLLLLATFGLRLLWISDMEWKADEKATVAHIASLGERPWKPMAEVASHSGVAHPSGFLYLLRWGTLTRSEPIPLVAVVALLNALSIAIPLWLIRRSPRLVLAFAMCATSMMLILGSRKIWAPDLVAVWLCLGMGFFAAALEPGKRSQRKRLAYLALGGFFLPLSGQMYLPGVFYAGLFSAIAFAWLLWRAPRRLAWAWLAGSIAGWLTLAPYFYAMIAQVPGTYAPGAAASHLEIKQLWAILRGELMLPSPGGVFVLYLKPGMDWLRQYYSGPAYYLTLAWTLAAAVLWIALWWATLIRTARNWRELGRDPLALTSAAVVAGIPVALFLARLGAHLHYWLGALPFAYYLAAWAAYLKPETRASQRLTRLAWICCVLSAVATIQFMILVSQVRGLPGEYGQTYRSQQP